MGKLSYLVGEVAVLIEEEDVVTFTIFYGAEFPGEGSLYVPNVQSWSRRCRPWRPSREENVAALVFAGRGRIADQP